MIDTWPIQVAIYQALTDPAGPYPVFDAVPQDAATPYIVIGEFTGQPDDDLDALSIDLSVQLHGWSRHAGKQEAHAILAFMRSRLDHQQVGAGVWGCSEDFATVVEDPDSTAASRLFHAVARYRIRAN